MHNMICFSNEQKIIFATLLVGMLAGCASSGLHRTDQTVYRAIADRQSAALGQTTNVDLRDPLEPTGVTQRIYAVDPRPVPTDLPDSFNTQSTTTETSAAGVNNDDQKIEQVAAAIIETTPDDATEPSLPNDDDLITASVFDESEMGHVKIFSLPDALAYAINHARELQTAKEDLYLAGLALTLERHLWTPQFATNISAQFADFGQVRSFDRAMETISEVSVSQRLPQGGEITARVISSLVRDLEKHITAGETGNVILEADIPLFRGVGKVAYESRYISERELIYAVRDYERFRRSFVVDIAADYFNLQQLKTTIANTHKSYLGRNKDWIKAEFVNRMGRSRNVFEAPRAKSIFRQAEASLVSSKEQYATALDRFKIRLGTSVDDLMDVVNQDADEASKELDALLPSITVSDAIDIALTYRLDLLNSEDGIDDARRGVVIAKNQLLPDLGLRGNVTLDSDAEQLNSMSFNTERATWRGFIELQMDDRVSESNAYRSSLITEKRSQRNHDEFQDRVRADVRRALRRIDQQDNLRKIQALNVEENERRLEAARAQFDLGRSTNQDVVDAENELLSARNDYARAVASYRIAILEFRRDTGTLRVTDDGRWEE